MKILIYMRPNSELFLTNLAKAIDKDCSIYKICDFKGYGDYWCGKALYLNEKDTSFSNDIMENIRLRCRFLRSIDKELAYSLIQKYTHGIREIFNKQKPDLVLAQIPDNYCMDIIQRIAVEHGSTLIHVIGEFIKGYSRLSLRGEYIYTREATLDEAKKVVKFLLDKSYIANYAKDLGNTRLAHSKHYLRRKLIEDYYYPMVKRFKGDKYNYHFNTIYYRNTRLTDYVSDKIDALFTDLEDINFDNTCIYVPLHVYPEATVDYYGDNPKFALYEDYMVNLLAKSDPSVRLLVKEHPAMFGGRNAKFYKTLKCIKNVVLVHPYINSNLILNKVKYVLTYSGSVGIEALIRDKVVFTLIDNYYSGLSPNAHRINRIDKTLLDYKYQEYDPVVFMRDLLCGLMDAKMGNQSNLASSDIERMAFYIKRYYKSRPVQNIN